MSVCPAAAPRTLGRVAALCLLALPASAEILWIEGEDAAEQETFRNDWYDAHRVAEMSGDAWINSFSEPGQERGWARYEVEVSEAGWYTPWLRVGTGDGHLTIRFGGEPEVQIDPEAIRAEDQKDRSAGDHEPAVQDERNLASDGATDARHLAWLRLEPVQLDAGTHEVKVWFGDPDSEKPHAGLDVMVLATEAFEPLGEFKPGEPNPRLKTADPADLWAFEPPTDTFDEAALLDLRPLNEPVAGEHGFIGLSADGMSFVRGDGRPIRFWGGTDYNQQELSVDELADHGRFLAKRGVNVVRWHGDLSISAGWPDAKKEAPTLETLDEENLDEAFKLVAAMKRAGIYSVLSPYWGSHTKVRGSWKDDFPHSGSGNLSGLVFFVPEVQAAYRGWLRELYTRPNPYTGVALKNEPAVAIIQLQNEDSLLFFTAGRIKGEAETILRGLFRDWLVAEHGSVDAVRERWRGFTHGPAEEDWKDGLPALLHPWDYGVDALEQKGRIPGFRERRGDQLAFMTHQMRSFNEETARFLREELGAPQLINAGNWRTSDPVLADDAERYSYAGNEVMAKNHYFAALHTGRTRGWQIKEDHIFRNASATRNPRELPNNVRQPAGFPFLITESLWVPPNGYEAEGPLIVASQQAQSGVDALFWFANHAPQWESARRREGPRKWTYATPMTLGQFPAAALLFREAMVDPVDPVVVEARPPADIWGGRMPLTSESSAFDPNRDEGLQAAPSAVETLVDPLAFLVGPVLVDYHAGSADRSEVADLGAFIAADGSAVRGGNGQTALDIDAGVYRIQSPRAQAAVGFLGAAGPIDLGDARFSIENEYAAVAAVSLDAQPLSTSERILVQMGTRARPTGWTVEEIELEIDGEAGPASRIVDTGETPWRVERLRGRLSLANDRPLRATVTDANFLPVRELPVERAEGRLEVELPEDALYLVLDR
ncbi:hypothetical protein [Phycisphaera mikurensis]|uniref:hypothetical protein n=1 Tax=Phycisphaera mikurensis TaxID=547188 RepID=UPI0012B577B9|nr:hypothetical protein [Phycisphaera mikurensis]MBB6442250.1 hypothetical protein [Phycisphaera mikurensis]